MELRLIDSGSVPAVRSQSLYHGLARARTERTPPTVVLATPNEPYVCVGYHQDVDRELDVVFCQRQRLPIVRRELGGGAVYLDANQLFVQWVMGSEVLPARIDDRFRLFARPLVGTYRDLGLDAMFRPVNDIHVEDRKICGTGAGRLGDAEVLVGNVIFDFDNDRMAQIIRAPNERFRAAVRRQLHRHMTSLRHELGTLPDQQTVKDLYRHHCCRTLGATLTEGRLTHEEVVAVEAADERLADAEFIHRAGGLTRPGVKIHEDVWVRYNDYTD